MQLFSADDTIFLKKPKKLLIIPLDQKFLLQRVFGSVELRQLFTLFGDQLSYSLFFSSLKLSNFVG